MIPKQMSPELSKFMSPETGREMADGASRIGDEKAYQRLCEERKIRFSPTGPL
jgi:hypothetical protein